MTGSSKPKGSDGAMAAYTPAGRASGGLLAARVQVAMTMAHNHPGIPGRDDGGGCPRCNAEAALNELERRSK